VIDERLAELGLVLPPVSPPAGNYVGCVVVDGMVHVGGHGPIDGNPVLHGKVGRDLTLEEGRRAARITALSILAHSGPSWGTSIGSSASSRCSAW